MAQRGARLPLSDLFRLASDELGATGAVSRDQPVDPRRLPQSCSVCGGRMYLVPGAIAGWYEVCENRWTDHGAVGSARFLGWDDRCLRFVELDQDS